MVRDRFVCSDSPGSTELLPGTAGRIPRAADEVAPARAIQLAPGIAPPQGPGRRFASGGPTASDGFDQGVKQNHGAHDDEHDLDDAQHIRQHPRVHEGRIGVAAVLRVKQSAEEYGSRDESGAAACFSKFSQSMLRISRTGRHPASRARIIHHAGTSVKRYFFAISYRNYRSMLGQHGLPAFQAGASRRWRAWSGSSNMPA